MQTIKGNTGMETRLKGRNDMCWHKWSKWEKKIQNYEVVLVGSRIAENMRGKKVIESRIYQERTCLKCGKVQQKRLENP